MQLKKLGVMPPEQPLPPKCYTIYQVMWANNGDTISRQYAGTAALKVHHVPLVFLCSVTHWDHNESTVCQLR